jgi:hypothetical protein
MHFTVINMGRQDFSLRLGGMIVTVLFFEMSPAAKFDFVARVGKIDARPRQEDINRLSADFLDISSRAETVAKQAMDAAGLQLSALETRGKLAVGWLSLGLCVVSIVGTLFINWLTGVGELKERVGKLETSVNLEKRVKALEDRLASNGSTQGGAAATPAPRKGAK